MRLRHLIVRTALVILLAQMMRPGVKAFVEVCADRNSPLDCNPYYPGSACFCHIKGGDGGYWCQSSGCDGNGCDTNPDLDYQCYTEMQG